MNIDDFCVSAAVTGGNLLEDKFVSARNIKERQILRGRADKNEVIVLGIIQGKKASAFDAYLLVKRRKDLVEFVDR